MMDAHETDKQLEALTALLPEISFVLVRSPPTTRPARHAYASEHSARTSA